MGNANTNPSVGQLFEQGVRTCRHSPRLELRLPDHPECQACCRLQMCESHDPTHPELLNIKTLVQALLSPQTAMETTSGQCNRRVEEENHGNLESRQKYLVRKLIYYHFGQRVVHK